MPGDMTTVARLPRSSYLRAKLTAERCGWSRRNDTRVALGRGRCSGEARDYEGAETARGFLWS
jgi:hypothetical protein